MLSAVIRWQHCMRPERNDHCSLGRARNGGAGLSGASLVIFNRLTLAPFSDRFDIDTQFPALRSGILRFSGPCCVYPCQPMDRCSCSDGMRGRGVPVLPSIPKSRSHHQAVGSNAYAVCAFRFLSSVLVKFAMLSARRMG